MFIPLMLGAAAVGLLLLSGGDEPALGAPPGEGKTGSTVFKGASGRNYMVGLGEESADGRSVISIHNEKGQLLLTALAMKGADEKLFLGRPAGTDDQEVAIAMQDFNVLTREQAERE